MQWKSGTLGLGATATINAVPEVLRTAYGTTTPLGVTLFLRIRPHRSAMGAMGAMDRMGPM